MTALKRHFQARKTVRQLWEGLLELEKYYSYLLKGKLVQNLSDMRAI